MVAGPAGRRQVVGRDADRHRPLTAFPPRGAPRLIRTLVRTDRLRLSARILGIAALTVGSAASFPGIYPTAASREARAELMATPVGHALGGPGYGVAEYDFGAMTSQEMLGFTAVLMALMSLLLVVRHTRGDEEAGRTELVGAGVVGRHAVLAAALAVTSAANVLLGLLIAVRCATSGVAGLHWTGSLVSGAALTVVGLVFAAVAAVTAQLVPHARTHARRPVSRGPCSRWPTWCAPPGT